MADFEIPRKLHPAEGPWWRSWLAVFGVPNALDAIASNVGLTRQRRWWLFWESNRSLRARATAAMRGHPMFRDGP